MAYHEPDKHSFHLCIVNLVIGTLYCAKGNFEFGISRIIKSLEPYDKKLGTDTWCASLQPTNRVSRSPILQLLFRWCCLAAGTTPSGVSSRWQRTWPSTC